MNLRNLPFAWDILNKSLFIQLEDLEVRILVLILVAFFSLSLLSGTSLYTMTVDRKTALGNWLQQNVGRALSKEDIDYTTTKLGE